MCSCDLWDSVPAGRHHLSPPTMASSVSAESSGVTSPALPWVSPEEQVNFGKSNMTFVLLTQRCWEIEVVREES